jgi:glycosyltransferase involved in cell wall biosynthesis
MQGDVSSTQRRRRGAGQISPERVHAEAPSPSLVVSVCLPTRDRGVRIAPTLASLRRLDHGSYEVVVVDQSTDDRSGLAFRETVGDDPRFSWIPSTSIGRSAACNIALGRARGAIVAFTDDDCLVPPDWLSGIERALANDPRIAAICGGDATRGMIPVFLPLSQRVHRSP